ncbi:hypothetical protein AHF37_08033 [Paragonimus kellicotti]|nr:hypothetical protein AHF37_08033 [Paragonimus kellicotti]
MLRNHTTVTEKLSASHAKERSSSKRPVKTENGQGCSLEDSQKSQICELTRQQKEQWTGLKVAQMKEIYELVLGYIEARKELLLKCSSLLTLNTC